MTTIAAPKPSRTRHRLLQVIANLHCVHNIRLTQCAAPEGTAALVPNTYRHLGTNLTHRLLDTQEQRDADKATEFALARYDSGMLTNRTNLSTYTNDGRGKDDFKEEWWTESRILLPIHISTSPIFWYTHTHITNVTRQVHQASSQNTKRRVHRPVPSARTQPKPSRILPETP